MDIFSERLRLARTNKGITQKQLAEDIGVSQQYYNQFEKNKGEPNLETLAKLATILEVNSDYLIGLTDVVETRKKAEHEFERRLKALEETMVDVLTLRDDEMKELYGRKQGSDVTNTFKKNLNKNEPL